MDTALAYGSEVVVGKAVAAAPEPVVVATKIPTKNGHWPARSGSHPDEMYPADWIVQCTEDSLRNLGLDTIDLQQLQPYPFSRRTIDRAEYRATLVVRR